MPAIVVAVNDKLLPMHTGLLLPREGDEGNGFTVTVIVAVGPVHPATVEVTE